jgi:hypothetical protein
MASTAAGTTIALLLALAPFPALLAASPPTPPAVASTSAEFVHAPTGMVLPAKLGRFERTRVQRYTADGSDMGASYGLRRDDHRMNVTVTIFPSDTRRAKTCRDEFIAAYEGVTARNAQVRVDEMKPVKAPPGHPQAEGYIAAFDEGDGVFDNERIALKGEIRLYCLPGGKWLVQYRATWPGEESMPSAYKRFLRELAWPKTLSRSPRHAKRADA